MIDETVFEYPLFVDVTMHDAQGAFYPWGLQELAIWTSEAHLEKLDASSDTLERQFGVAWVLLSTSMEIKRPFTAREKLHARTWHTSHALPIYRREIAFYNERNEQVLACATFSSLLDVKRRRLCMDRTVLQRFCLPEGQTLLEAQNRCVEEPAFTLAAQRDVQPSWIDGVGHVNNVQYSRIVFDALTPQERARVMNMRRMDVWFKQELKLGDAFAVETAQTDGALFARGMLGSKASFVMKFTD